MSEINDNGVVTLPSALDSLNRNNYTSDSAYLEAAADLTMKRNSKEFQEAFRIVQREHFDRKTEESKQQMKQEIEDLKKKIVLDSVETEKVKTQASEKAQTDLKAGKISAVNLSDAIWKYEQELTQKVKGEKATRQAMNGLLRESLGR